MPDQTPERSDFEASKPRRWLAVILSLITAGLGHVYVGRPGRGLGIAVGLELLAVLGAATAARVSGLLIWLAVPVALLVIALVAVDAARLASRPRTRFFTRRAIILACGAFLLLTFALSFGAEWGQNRWGARPFRIPSGGMFPTLLIGDHLQVDLGAFRRRDPERGEVVIFEVAKSGSAPFPADRRPDLPREAFCKRILGLPGDQIQIRGGAITVNGELLEQRPLGGTFQDERGRVLTVYEEEAGPRSWRVLDDPDVDRLPDLPPITVPQGRYFVLGDNRDHSMDSRMWGTVAREDLIGPATSIYWSWDFNGTWAELLNPWHWPGLLSEKTRWDRIGQAID